MDIYLLDSQKFVPVDMKDGVLEIDVDAVGLGVLHTVEVCIPDFSSKGGVHPRANSNFVLYVKTPDEDMPHFLGHTYTNTLGIKGSRLGARMKGASGMLISLCNAPLLGLNTEDLPEDSKFIIQYPGYAPPDGTYYVLFTLYDIFHTGSFSEDISSLVSSNSSVPLDPM